MWPAQVLIGVPGEDVGTIKDAGEADSYLGRDRDDDCQPGARFNLGADAHPGDRLGAAVASTPEGDAPDNVLLGTPGYDVATSVDAGVVLMGTCLWCRPSSPLFGSAQTTVYTQSNGAVSGAHYGAVLNR